MDEAHKIISFIIAAIVFLISWIYCIAAYGFFIGIVFGWIPALIAAAAAGFLWPLVLGLLFLGGAILFIIYIISQLN